MKEPTLQVKIGGKTVSVPIYRDEQTTLSLVELVNRRLQEIEETSPRVDTQAFALQTAYAFAADLARLEAAASAEEGELVQALSRLQTAFDDVLKTLYM
jgi:cell division protein ZapA (FtsZ GTPase activity inhibitor)